ncbi:MAG TPA: hypothetical protein VM487_21065 [Phycisphaerae bacterium]|nr:hypothetical protein [Phycisphaerae bacterium]
MRVALVACSKGKLPHAAPARYLYQGNLFRLSRSWVLQRMSRGQLDAWAILSAKHGLVMPDQMLEPYELALSDLSRPERAAWASAVRDQLVATFGRGARYSVLAGADYSGAVAGLPHVERVFERMGKARKARGQRGAGIGAIMSELKASQD